LLLYGKFSQANQLIEEELANFPNSTKLWLFKATIFQKIDNQQISLHCFHQAQKIKPNNKLVKEKIFRYYLSNKEYKKANDTLNSFNKKRFPKHYAKMEILFLKNTGGIEECFECCKNLLLEYPNARFGINQVIDICSLLRTPEAIEYLNKLKNTLKTQNNFIDLYKKILRKQFRYYSLKYCIEGQLENKIENRTIIEYLDILYSLKEKKEKIEVLESKLFDSKLSIIELNSLFNLTKYSEKLKIKLNQYLEQNPFYSQYSALKENSKRLNQEFPISKSGSQANQSIHKHNVDLVYTWVDMSDPVLLKKFERQEGFNPNLTIDDQKGIHRYHNQNEIVLSLLSSQKYFSWVNNIYIVTNQQSFDLNFLAEDFQKKIKFVNHNEIFPQDDIKIEVFHSNLIEAFLFNIIGLEEHFLYFNDDVILGNYINYKDLFSPEGIPYSFLRSGKSKSFNAHKALTEYTNGKVVSWKTANSNALEIFNQENNSQVCFVNIHFGIFLLKSTCKEIYTKHKQHWKETFFRESTRGENAVFLPLLASLSSVSRHHQVIPNPNIILAQSVTFQFELNEENIRFIEEQKPIFYCINSILDPKSIANLKKLISNFN